ncbi:hypothetical protein Q427_26285 [Halomonas sp. BC04]|nr:hypothetical protein Q427_26285 [Halomonas sp. BC04]
MPVGEKGVELGDSLGGEAEGRQAALRSADDEPPGVGLAMAVPHQKVAIAALSRGVEESV